MKEFCEIIYKGIDTNEDYEKTIKKVVKECFKTEKLENTNLYMSITLTEPEEIKRINLEFRNIDRATDVLSFPMFEKDEIEEIVSKQEEDRGEDILGDIVISIEKVQEQAKEYGHSFERELAYMVVHGFYHLKQTGTMAIVLPHGVLFRGAAEGTIRKILLENGSIYAVIGLPSNMFYNTSIPTCIVVLKKHREGRDVLFVDASNLFVKEKKQNVMQEEHINRVLELYRNRESVEKQAYLASYEDIEANDFNLNIPRYVDTTEEEPEIDLSALIADIKDTDQEIKNSTNTMINMLQELTFSDDETERNVTEFIKTLGEV